MVLRYCPDAGDSGRYRVNRLRVIQDGATLPVQTLPQSWCPAPELLKKLQRFVDALQHFPLIRLMEDFLNTDHLIKPFIQLPASCQSHHSEPAGLLRHSLDCAQRMWGFLHSDEHTDREIAAVAAFLHDIGKLRTHRPDGKLQRAGLLVDHRHYTLEILQPFLQGLDQVDEDTANLLRYIWTWNPADQQSPRQHLVTIVHVADRYSAMQGAAEREFRHAEPWKQCVTTQGPGPKRRFWRRLPCQQRSPSGLIRRGP